MGARIKGSSASIIASHNGGEGLVKLLLENCADVNEMGVAGIDEAPEDLEDTALHLTEKVRKDICTCSIMGLMLSRQTVRQNSDFQDKLG